MTYKFNSAIASAVLLAATLTPLTASATEACVGATCTITFEYTGASEEFQVPDGASSMSFEVLGAAGARGGRGGSVKGKFTELPRTLLIYVGGAGNLGSGAAGGFNGGGNAGSYRGNEGSGGGASDIRSTGSMEARIVVAGGGGGGGGYSGALGAAGGGLIADTGGSGQGGGGGGGTQSLGGVAGVSNGGSNATGGSFAAGGVGGSSWNAGGGGGGGGWYGGGGGGSDGDDCCSDGGGGGGGSSHAAASFTQDVQHLVGARAGNGQIILSYTILPEVVSFTGQQISKDLAEFSLLMTEDIIGLAEANFELTGADCEIAEIAITTTAAAISIIGCLDGNVELKLLAHSVGTEAFGPSSDSTASLAFDRTGPKFQFLEDGDLTSGSALVIGFSQSDSVTPIKIEMFEFLGCSMAELLVDSISLSECVAGSQVVYFLANSLSDKFGNLGPAQSSSYRFEIDQTKPSAIWSEVVIEGTGPFTLSATLSFSEQVDFDPRSVSLISDADCTFDYEAVNEGWLFLASCGYGDGRFELAADSLTDLVGFTGPEASSITTFRNQEPLVTQTPTPAPTPTPTEPEPARQEVPEPAEPSLEPVEEPQTTSPVSEPQEPEEVLDDDESIISAEIIDQALAIISTRGPKTVEQVTESPKLLVVVSESMEVVSTPVAVPTAQEISGPPIDIEPLPQNNTPWFILGFGVLGMLSGLGIWRFSGR